MLDPYSAWGDLVAEELAAGFRDAYQPASATYAGTIERLAREALERISGSNALYHNVHHTILVSLVGQQILKGRAASGEPVSPDTWLNFIVSLLYHDVGFVPDLCAADGGGVFASGIGDETVTLPREATDASLAPYHVDRAKLFVEENLASDPGLDTVAIAANIERTRFPVPEEPEYQRTDDLPGLARAADLLGQVAEPRPRRRYPALFFEFEETGINEKLGYACPRDLQADFPRFFSKVVARYCTDAMRWLEATEEGRRWLLNVEAQLDVTAEPPRTAASDATSP